jgi:hypothetical protein
MVAMMPLIVVQVMGVIYKIRTAAIEKKAVAAPAEDYEVIVLWD